MSIDDLIKTAIEMRAKAIAPYSGYKVGAAVQTNTGKIIGGCNIENSSYSLTCCAERVALFRAIAEGFTKFKALSVSTKNTGMPCGAGPARQLAGHLAAGAHRHAQQSVRRHCRVRIGRLSEPVE